MLALTGLHAQNVRRAHRPLSGAQLRPSVRSHGSSTITKVSSLKPRLSPLNTGPPGPWSHSPAGGANDSGPDVSGLPWSVPQPVLCKGPSPERLVLAVTRAGAGVSTAFLSKPEWWAALLIHRAFVGGRWAASTSSPLCTDVLRPWGYRYLFETLLSCPLGLYPDVELLGHMVVLRLIF